WGAAALAVLATARTVARASDRLASERGSVMGALPLVSCWRHSDASFRTPATGRGGSRDSRKKPSADSVRRENPLASEAFPITVAVSIYSPPCASDECLDRYSPR